MFRGDACKFFAGLIGISSNSLLKTT